MLLHPRLLLLSYLCRMHPWIWKINRDIGSTSFLSNFLHVRLSIMINARSENKQKLLMIRKLRLPFYQKRVYIMFVSIIIYPKNTTKGNSIISRIQYVKTESLRSKNLVMAFRPLNYSTSPTCCVHFFTFSKQRIYLLSFPY